MTLIGLLVNLIDFARAQTQSFTIEWQNFSLFTCVTPSTIQVPLFSCVPPAYQQMDDMACLQATTIDFDGQTCQSTTTTSVRTIVFNFTLLL